MNLCLEEYLKRQQIGREINIEIAVSWNIPVQSRCGYLEVVKSRRHGSYIRHITSCQSIQDLFDVSAKASLISDWWFRFYIGEMILVIEIWRWFFMIWQVSNKCRQFGSGWKFVFFYDVVFIEFTWCLQGNIYFNKNYITLKFSL